MCNWGYLNKACLLALCVLSTAAYSENFRVDLSAGAAHVGNSDYDTGVAADASFSYFLNGLVMTAGLLNIEELRPEDEDSDTELSVGGAYLGLAKEFDLDILKFEIGGGGIYAETQASFRGRNLGDDDDFSPYINLKLVKDLNKLISLHGGWKYIDDLSGGDLHLYQAGVRFSF